MYEPVKRAKMQSSRDGTCANSTSVSSPQPSQLSQRQEPQVESMSERKMVSDGNSLVGERGETWHEVIQSTS